MSFRPEARGSRPVEADWLTLGQAARFLGVAQSTIRKWSDQGRVPAFYTPGGHRRFRQSDLEAFIQRSGPGLRGSGPHVLVVDDDARLRASIRVSLEAAGYSVAEAESVPMALAGIEANAPGLVLLDVDMPGDDGWELLCRLEERHGSIPVVVYSGKVDDRIAGEATERGASAFLGKPFDPRELVERAKQLLPV
jgi:excisionase family DNA binding protein